MKGMSSDESDGEELIRNSTSQLQNPKFQIIRPKWRANILSNFLHVFDSYHMIAQRSDDGESRGAFPCLWNENALSPVYSNTAQGFIQGLPKNAYSDRWLATRKEITFSVGPTNETYDFSHHPDVLK